MQSLFFINQNSIYTVMKIYQETAAQGWEDSGARWDFVRRVGDFSYGMFKSQGKMSKDGHFRFDATGRRFKPTRSNIITFIHSVSKIPTRSSKSHRAPLSSHPCAASLCHSSARAIRKL